jgi:TonB-linked SusC/RagA family outer membrane protein
MRFQQLFLNTATMRKLQNCCLLLGCTIGAQLLNATYGYSQKTNYAYAIRDNKASQLSGNENYGGENDQKQNLFSVLKELNKEKGVYFISNKSLDDIKVSPVQNMDASVESILADLLKDTHLTYKKVDNKTYVIIVAQDDMSATATTGIAVNADNAAAAADYVQEKISGKVTGPDSKPIIGATVQVKGTKKGAITDKDGSFTIAASKGDVLVINYVGFDPKEVTIADDNNITVSLTEAAKQLTDVYVTALGIKKSAKDLSYSVQKVSNEELTTVKETNFTNSLSGKASNVTITQGSGGVGSATNIILRGNNSLNGSGQPLIVIDGIPVVNNNSHPTTGQAQFGQNFLTPDQLSTINSSDVEEVTILKGPTAAALYGSQAANGAIIVTTKSGKNGQTRVNFSTNNTFQSALYYPKLQTEYGGAANDNGNYSWGAKDPNAAYAGSFYKDFLKTGVNSSNAVDITTGNENAQLYAAYANTTANGIIPNNSLSRNNFDLKGTTSMFKKFIEFTAKFSYVDQTVHNPYAPGQYLNPYYTMMTLPANTNMPLYKDKNTLTLDSLPYQNWAYNSGTTGTDNPYWDAYKVLTTDNLNRMILSGDLKFNFTNYLNLMVRANMDKSNEDYMNQMYQGTVTSLASSTGGFDHKTLQSNQNYGDAILNFNKQIATDWHLTALGGGSLRDYTQTGTEINSGRNGMYHPNIFISSNVNYSGGGTVSDIYDRRQIQSLFYSAEFGYKNAVFLSTTGRNDWSSTLPPGKNAYFYPSVGLSAVLTDLFKGLSSSTMNYLKVRSSYTEVGNDLPTFIINPVSTINSNGSLTTPKNVIMPGTTLKPELTTSFEAGVDAGFFNNLIRLEATYYNTNTDNQLFTVTAPPSSGYSFYYVNGGKIQNKGVELTLSVTPNIGTVKWTSTVNFSKNVNTVKSLIGGVNYLTYSQLANSTSYFQKIVPGGSLGDFYASKFQRNKDGSYKVDTYYIDGVQQTGTTPLVQDQAEKVGNAFPDFLLSWGNKFNYKNFQLSFLIDGHFGGEVISMTQAMLDYSGNSVQSAQDRDKGYVLINNQQVTDVKKFYQLRSGIGGALGEYTYSATAIRLRELSFIYNLPATFFNNSKYVKGISVGLLGRNLFFFHKVAPIDPEVVSNNAGGQNGQNEFLGLEMYNMPSTRSVGFSVNVHF